MRSVFRTIALLGIVGRWNGVSPTAEVLEFALAPTMPAPDVTAAIKALLAKSAIVFRRVDLAAAAGGLARCPPVPGDVVPLQTIEPHVASLDQARAHCRGVAPDRRMDATATREELLHRIVAACAPPPPRSISSTTSHLSDSRNSTTSCPGATPSNCMGQRW